MRLTAGELALRGRHPLTLHTQENVNWLLIGILVRLSKTCPYLVAEF